MRGADKGGNQRDENRTTGKMVYVAFVHTVSRPGWIFRMRSPKSGGDWAQDRADRGGLRDPLSALRQDRKPGFCGTFLRSGSPGETSPREVIKRNFPNITTNKIVWTLFAYGESDADACETVGDG